MFAYQVPAGQILRFAKNVSFVQNDNFVQNDGPLDSSHWGPVFVDDFNLRTDLSSGV